MKRNPAKELERLLKRWKALPLDEKESDVRKLRDRIDELYRELQATGHHPANPTKAQKQAARVLDKIVKKHGAGVRLEALSEAEFTELADANRVVAEEAAKVRREEWERYLAEHGHPDDDPLFTANLTEEEIQRAIDRWEERNARKAP